MRNNRREGLAPNIPQHFYTGPGTWYPPMPEGAEQRFGEEFGEWRERVLATAEDLFGDEDRIVMADAPIEQLRSVSPEEQREDAKPYGLWYACGLDWIRWVSWEMPHWLTPYIYGIDVDLSDMKVIETDRTLDAFTRMYASSKYTIRWSEVAEVYAGIEICPYIDSRRMTSSTSWYYPWDVASGCVWEAEAVLDLRLRAAP